MTRALFRIALLAALSLTAAARADAQTRTPPAPSPRADDAPRTTADEDFQLDIGERRIAESDFHAATAVEAGDAAPNGLDLRVGAVVRANEIEVLLRNVRVRVRFRASLAPVLRLLDERRARPRPE